MNYTIVTCLYDLKKRDQNQIRRDVEFYLNLTQDLNCNMVIYCDIGLKEEILKRKSKGNFKIIEFPLEELEYYKNYNDILNNEKMNYSIKDDKNTNNYFLLTWNKFILMKESIRNNYFNTDYFFWIDYGLQHVLDEKKYNCKFETLLNNFELITKDNIEKSIFMVLNDLNPNIINNENFYKRLYQYCAGGVFGGKQDIFNKIITLFDNKLKELIDKKIVSTEEHIMADIIYNNKNLFELTYGDYYDLIENFYPYNINFDKEYIIKIMDKNFNENNDNYIGFDILNKLYKDGEIRYNMYNIFVKLYNLTKRKECYECGIKLINSIEKEYVNVNNNIYFDIIFKMYIVSFYVKKEEAKKYIDYISNNKNLYNEYLKNRSFNDQQFSHILGNKTIFKKFEFNPIYKPSTEIALVTLSNLKYFDKAYNTIKDIRTNGNWLGDLIYIYGNDMILEKDKLESLKKYNVMCKYFPDVDMSYRIDKINKNPFAYNYENREVKLPFQFHKLHAFNVWFKKWKRILFIDAGYHIYHDIKPILNLDCDNCILIQDENYNVNLFGQWERKTYKYLFDELNSTYDLDNLYKINYVNANNSVFYYDTNIITDETYIELIHVTNYYINTLTNEQAIMNLYFGFNKKILKLAPEKDENNKYYLFNLRNRHGKPEEYIMVKYIDNS